MKKLFIAVLVLSSFAVTSIALAGSSCCAVSKKQKEEAVKTTESAASVQDAAVVEIAAVTAQGK